MRVGMHVITVPIVPTSMGLLMPRKMFTPTPWSAHCSPISFHVLSRGVYSVLSLSVSYNIDSSAIGESAPTPIVGNAEAKTVTCPPLPTYPTDQRNVL